MKVDITSLSHRSVARRLAVRLLFIPAAHLIFTGGDAIPHERQERESEEGIREKCFGIGSMVRGQRQPCSGSGAQGVQGQPAGSIPTALTCDVTEGGGGEPSVQLHVGGGGALADAESGIACY